MATLGGESIENAFAMSNAKVKNIGRISYSAVAIFSIVLMFIGASFFTDNVMKVSDRKLMVKSTHNCLIKKKENSYSRVLHQRKIQQSLPKCSL